MEGKNLSFSFLEEAAEKLCVVLFEHDFLTPRNAKAAL